MLSICSVSHAFGQREALHSVDLELTPGITALLGVNGAGKSTLLNVAAGGLRPSSGTVEIDGKSLYHRAGRRSGLGKVALMPQSATFPGGMTAREVVAYVAWMKGLDWRTARAAASDALDRVGLSDRADERMKTLSGGMRRRVALAQALASAPRILLLDEPSTGLDPRQRRVMVDLLRELDGTVLLSSHVMEDVADVADRVVVIDAGRLVFDGSMDELRSRAPDPTDARAAEAGFLATLTSGRTIA